MTRHIFLIGFMGSGKTHWGRVVAEQLGCLFLDLDEFIETNAGMTISEIFASSGENGFRELERDYLRQLAALPPAVVATGGGTPCFFDNMDWMKAHGVTIYLKTPPEVLFERLKNERRHRPLLKNLDDAGLRAFIRERLKAREPIYRRSEIVIKNDAVVADLTSFISNPLTFAPSQPRSTFSTTFNPSFSMNKMIARFPDQLGEALALVSNIHLNKHAAPFRSIFISGLGGSGIGGGFVQDFVRTSCKLPVVVSKGYHAPAWANKHTLAICSSYSGNTEETLSTFEQLLGTGAKIVCIASGGKLIELAKSHGLDFVQLPGGWSSPRACLGYSVVAQLGVLRAAKLIPGKLLTSVKTAQKLLVKEDADIQKKARKIAGFLAEKTPVIYAPDHIESVAVRWRQQINENAKMLCWHHVVPEMNHNELVGWRNNRPELAVVWLRNRDDFQRTATRMDINKEIVEHFTGSSIEVWSKGKSLTEKAFYLTHLGDWVSYYLAEIRDVDPVEIKVIDYLKGELAKVS